MGPGAGAGGRGGGWGWGLRAGGGGGWGPRAGWGGGPGAEERALRAVYGNREDWGLGAGTRLRHTRDARERLRTLANASRTLRERFSDDPWSTIGPLDPDL